MDHNWELLKLEQAFRNYKQSDIDLIILHWKLYKPKIPGEIYYDILHMLKDIERAFYAYAVKNDKKFENIFSMKMNELNQTYFSKIPKTYRILKGLSINEFEKEFEQDIMGSAWSALST